MTSGRKYYVGLLVTFLGACLWGLSGVCIQHLHEAYALDSLTITCVRSITASVLFLLILFVRYSAELRRLMSHRRDAFVVVLFGGALFASQATYAVSTGLTNAGTATVLQMLGSVFVLIIACVRFKRRGRSDSFGAHGNVVDRNERESACADDPSCGAYLGLGECSF